MSETKEVHFRKITSSVNTTVVFTLKDGTTFRIEDIKDAQDLQDLVEDGRRYRELKDSVIRFYKFLSSFLSDADKAP